MRRLSQHADVHRRENRGINGTNVEWRLNAGEVSGEKTRILLLLLRTE
jgi:hypothetical protein